MINDSDAVTEARLIALALEGDKRALSDLIKRYQNYVYNIALRLFVDPDDALDATQEVLIKVVTGLRTFRGDSKFSTWLYRITVNHFLNSPVRKTERLIVQNAAMYAGFTEEEPGDVDEELKEEVRMLCSTAMLLCLNREQRLVYVIGEIFQADHTLGAELFEISPGNFRVKLHRAKADLMSYISGKCGLVNPANPCRCHKKTVRWVKQGVVSKETLRFNRDYRDKVEQLVRQRKDEACDEIELRLKTLFADSPFQVKKELDTLLSDIVG